MKRCAGLIVLGAIIVAFCPPAAWGAEQGELPVGEMKIATFETAAAKPDNWTFDAEPGDTILLRAVAPDCNSYTLEIDLYDANDVNEGNWTQTDLIEQKLDRKGKGPYKVVVTRHDVKPNMTTYLPAVYAIAVFNLSSPAGEDIPCGVTQEELAPDLDTGADGAGMDVFKFDGKAGDRILLSAIPYYDADKLRLSLYDANNVREGNWTQTDLIGYKLQGKGPYRIVVIRCDDDLDLPTNYNITLFNLSSCKGTPISYQSTLGNRPLPCDGIDVFTFNGKPEDKIVLHATVIDTRTELRVVLYDPDQSERDETTPDQIDSVLKQDGLYQIAVLRCDDNISLPGSYDVRLECTCTLNMSFLAGGSITPAAGKHTYSWGKQVPVTASEDACHTFTGWTGTAVDAGQVADPGSAGTTVTIDRSCTLKANFTVKTSCLTVSSTGGGTMVVKPGGTVEPGATKEFSYDCGATVKVTAQPDAYHHFAGWPAGLGAIDPADPSGRTLIITVAGAIALASPFKPNNLQTVSSTGGSIEFPDGRPLAFHSGMPVRVVARPDPCYQFTHWSGTAVQGGKLANLNEAEISVTVDGDYTLFATFDPDKEKTLTISASVGGTVTSPGAGDFVYNCGDSVPIAASGDECHKFARWTGTAVDAGKVADARAPSTTVVLDRDYTLQANFEQDVWPPQVKTLDAEDITSISARLGGTLISDGNGVCEWRFRYGRVGQEASDCTNWRSEPKTGEAFKKLVENLAPETAYSFEAEARNCAGTGKGGEFYFTTPPKVKLALSASAGGRIVEPNMPLVELPIPADVNVAAEAAPDCFFWVWEGTAVDGGKLLTAITDPNAQVLVDANDTLHAVFLRWIWDWEDDVDRGECRGALYSTSQIWDFADAAGDVNGTPQCVFKILGTASNGQPPLPGTVLTCTDPNLAAALHWWPSDPYGTSGRRGMVASSGLRASIHIPPSPAGASIWVQVIWRELNDADSALLSPGLSASPLLVDMESFIEWCCLAEYYLPGGWHRSTYGWFVDPNTEKISFTVTGAVILDCLIVDTCRESANRWMNP